MIEHNIDLRACRKKTCKRYKVGVYRTSPYCSECGCKLVSFWQLYQDGDPDSPGLVDDAPDAKGVTPPSKLQHELWTGANSMQNLLPNPPAIIIPLPDQQDFVATTTPDGTKGTWSTWRIMLRMYNLVEFSDFPGSWTVYMEYLGACGVGKMTDKATIADLIARVMAYATANNLDPVRYSSFDNRQTQSAVSPKGRIVGFKDSKPADTFTCDADIEPCSLTPKASIYVPSDMWQDFIWLTKKFSTEWLAYFKGEREVKDNTVIWHVTGFYFPPQTCTGAHVDIPDDYRTEPDTIGDIHSHVDMSAFFSTEDKKHWNWPVHIVLNRKAECDAVVAHQLPCGKTTRAKAAVFVTGSAEQDALAATLTAKITEAKHSHARAN
jgi:proteasome lid subunit RPN8/RPN11